MSFVPKMSFELNTPFFMAPSDSTCDCVFSPVSYGCVSRLNVGCRVLLQDNSVSPPAVTEWHDRVVERELSDVQFRDANEKMEQTELLLSNSNGENKCSKKMSQELKIKEKKCSRSGEPSLITDTCRYTDAEMQGAAAWRNVLKASYRTQMCAVYPFLFLFQSSLALSHLAPPNSESPGSRLAGVQVQAESRPHAWDDTNAYEPTLLLGAIARLSLFLLYDIRTLQGRWQKSAFFEAVARKCHFCTSILVQDDFYLFFFTPVLSSHRWRA